MGKSNIELTDAKFDHFDAFTQGPCCAAHGPINKAAARAGDVYVYYRKEWPFAATYRVYSAKGVGKLKDSETIECAEIIAEFEGFSEAKASEYRQHFIAFHALLATKGWVRPLRR